MSETGAESEHTGRIDDAEEEQETSSTTEGAAAEGEYDPAQGSPGSPHPVGQDFPEETSGYGEPERKRTEQQD